MRHRRKQRGHVDQYEIRGVYERQRRHARFPRQRILRASVSKQTSHIASPHWYRSCRMRRRSSRNTDMRSMRERRMTRTHRVQLRLVGCERTRGLHRCSLYHVTRDSKPTTEHVVCRRAKHNAALLGWSQRAAPRRRRRRWSWCRCWRRGRVARGQAQRVALAARGVYASAAGNRARPARARTRRELARHGLRCGRAGAADLDKRRRSASRSPPGTRARRTLRRS